MTVGFPRTAVEVNARAGQLSQTIRDTFTQVRTFQQALATVTDVELGAAPYSFSGGDIAVLRSSYVDLGKLARAYTGYALASDDVRVNGYAAGEANVATATSATTLTRVGATWVSNIFTGRVVVAASGVYGNIASNTATVLTIDQWSSPATPGGAAGATPLATTAYTILPAYDYRTFSQLLTGFV